VAAATVLLLAGLLLPAATAHAAQVAPAGPSAGIDEYGATAVLVTNRVRQARHLRTLRVDLCVRRYAGRQATRMAAQRRMFHQDLEGPLRACGLRMTGENVAAGFPDGRTVVRRGWMRSPGHRANILEPRYRLVAVAARRGSDGVWYACQLFGRR
jgi:uncharacterized protein YkwD